MSDLTKPEHVPSCVSTGEGVTVPSPTPRTDACEVPLVEQLRSVPVNAHEWVKEFPAGWTNIPYGAMCHKAADALAAKDAEIARRKAQLDMWTSAAMDGNAAIAQLTARAEKAEMRVKQLEDKYERH